MQVLRRTQFPLKKCTSRTLMDLSTPQTPRTCPPVIGQESSNHPTLPKSRATKKASDKLKKSDTAQSSSSSPDSDPATAPPHNLRDLHLNYASNFKTSATVNSADYLERIKVIAHVSNGITLQAGLMDGKISMDAAVEELLNLGTSSVAEIVNFKLDKVNAWASKLKDFLKNQVLQDQKVTDKLKRMEIEILGLDQIRKDSIDLDDVIEQSKLDTYFAKIKEVKDKKYDYEPFSDASIRDNPVSQSLANILLNRDTAPYYDYKYLSSDIELMVKDLEKLKKINKEKTLKMYGLLAHGTEMFRSLERMVDLMARRENYSLEIGVDTPQMIRGTLETVIGLTTDEAMSDVNQILELVNSVESDQFKKHSIGFFRGILSSKHLERESRDPWLGKVLNVSEEHLASITSGLQPLIKASDHLETVNDKLMSVRPNALSRSLGYFQSFVTTMSSYSPMSKDVEHYLVDFLLQCEHIHPVLRYDHREPGVNLIDYVKSVQKSILGMSEISIKLAKLDMAALKSEGRKVQKLLKFTNLGDEEQTLKEIPGVRKKLERGGLLKSFENRVAGIQTIFNDMNIKTFIHELLPNADSVHKTDMERFKKFAEKENKVFECFQRMSSDTEKLITGIGVMRKLQTVNADEIEPFEVAAFQFSEFSKELATISSIPVKMKNAESNATLELNKMAQSLQQPDAIQYSTSALHSVYGLVELESAISQLKDVGSVVSEEISKVQIADDRKKLERQWGRRHAEEIDSLGTVIEEAKRFVTKIDVRKFSSLANYSAPLNGLVTYPDVIISASEKSKALNTLISSYSQTGRRKRAGVETKIELIVAKDILNKIALLNLKFAKRAAHFKEAPIAFQSFHKVLRQFVATQEKSSKIVISGSEDCGITILHIILSIVTTLLLALIAFIAYVFYQKKKQDAKSRELSIRRDEFEQEMADKIRKQLEELERREKKSKMNGVGKKQEKSGPISQYFPETISDPGSLPKNGTPTASPLKTENGLRGVRSEYFGIMGTGTAPAATPSKFEKSTMLMVGNDKDVQSQYVV